MFVPTAVFPDLFQVIFSYRDEFLQAPDRGRICRFFMKLEIRFCRFFLVLLQACEGILCENI